ncbi:MAG: hypothetical protein E7333_09040 [Clostridiales bacterium]|nr:hypothetical protein [Clostridiales bacterium]
MIWNDFWGFGGYARPAEGYMSWQHLTFVTLLVVLMTLLAVLLGRRNRHQSPEKKNRVLAVSAILIDSIEIAKIVVLSIRYNDAAYFIHVLPLFLCSIQLVAIPIAAFSKGRLKEAALDFVMIFGLLGALMGTYFAGNNYTAYPVLSMDNVFSGVTHCISGFCSLYIMLSGMASMEKRNIPFTAAILGGFSVAAYIANIFTDANYMFLTRGDGTPYDIVYNWVSGHPVLYPLIVVGLFVVYIIAYYQMYYLITRRMHNSAKQSKGVAA